jgi:hypothetical protein
MFPFSIQSETIVNWVSDIVTPTRGSMFGWLSDLHVTTSLQNFCARFHQKVGKGPEYNRQLTPIIFCRSLVEYVLRTFTATCLPECSPFHTSANPPLYSAHPIRSYLTVTRRAPGIMAWRPQTLYNNLRHLFRMSGERSGTSSRACIV